MRLSTAGMPKGGSSSGGAPAAEAPLIDFGNDDHSSGAFIWPENHTSTTSQDVDPFSWTTDELYISATPKDPFDIEELLTATPAASNVDPFELVAGNASNTIFDFASSGHAAGMDLLTGGVPAVVPQNLTTEDSPGFQQVAVNPFVHSSSGEQAAWARPGFLDSSSSMNTRVSSSDESFILNDNNPFGQADVFTKSAQPWSSFHDEGSFQDALSEDFSAAESQTSQDGGTAVDSSSIDFSERTRNGNGDRRFIISSEQAGGGVSLTEKGALTSNSNPMKVPSSKPPPQLPESESSKWASPSSNGRQKLEFLASGGGNGVYRAPVREISHAGNPVALELRPRPLRLREVNQSIRKIMCTDTSLWAAFDHGLKVWDIKAACSTCSEGGNNPLGDEDAASYSVLSSGPTLCLAMDTGNQVVWTGHRDGKMKAWPLNIRCGDPEKRDPVDHALVWDAHQAPVTAITITPYGELWTGSENGQIKAWPCEVTSRALQRAAEGSPEVGAVLAKSSVLIRGPLGGNNPSQTEVRVLLAEHSAGRVWSAGVYHITLWDARTREMVKSFEAQTNLPSPELSQSTESLLEERMSRKEKNMGWLQRSRNAFMGAADAVRRAADRLGQEEARRLETLAVSEDGTVWGGFGNGQLLQWNNEGTRQRDVLVTPVAVKSLLAVGSRLWVGFTNGRIEVLARSGKSLGCWGTQGTSLSHMAKGGNYVFTLAADGGILGWHVASLSNLDTLIQEELFKRSDKFTLKRHVKIFAGTWNVSQEKASPKALRVWLKEPAAEASLVCIGLQEMEMGAGSIGLAAVKETVGVGLLEKGSANGQWWLDSVGSAIGEGKDFERVGDRQLAGLIIGVWVRRNIRQFIGDVDAAAVPCGFGRTFGNKGAVGVRLSAFRRTICLVNGHFAAHMEKVLNRNSDFDYCYKQMTFGPKPSTVAFGGGGTILPRGHSRRLSHKADSQESMVEGDAPSFTEQEVAPEVAMPELSDTDVLIWFGDFNYRIDMTYDQAINCINEKKYDTLIMKDQLRIEMTNGRTFPGMREAGISFPPTYKFDRGTQLYDSSEKKRVPAYCDRVVFRDSFDGSTSASSTSLIHPAQATVVRYDACMEALDSDHKPVQCLLGVDLAVLDEAARRREYGDILLNDQRVLSFLEQSNVMPQSRLDRNSIVFKNSNADLTVTNDSKMSWTTFMVRCDGLYVGEDCPCGNHRASKTSINRANILRSGNGFPQWLQVLPAAGVIGPNSSVTITLQYGVPGTQNDYSWKPSEAQPRWWSDCPKDECLKLVLIMSSSPLTKVNQHRICVRRTR